MKPIIGIITRPETSTDGHKVTCIYESIRKEVIRSGGIPLGILPLTIDFDESNDDINKAINLCDGIILQGGDNFYNYDIEYLKYIYEQDIPVLGICLGMQLMGHLFGGELININANFHKQNDKNYVHRIYIDRSSKLYRILKQNIINTNSRHKSALINPNLDIVGISEDGVIEAIEDKNKKFFIGIQWHPESMTAYDNVESRIFDYFVNVCRK